MNLRICLIFFTVLSVTVSASYAQFVEPDISFREDPQTHNAHLCSDGKFLYTCNGGIAEKGKISKFDLKGNWIADYKINLDMRSIMYNKDDKHLYVNCYDRNIYMIDYLDTEESKYFLVHKNLYDNDQAGLALGKKGKRLYYLEQGTLTVFDFSNGEVLETFNNIRCGSAAFSGGAVIAAGKNRFYTWDSDKQEIYVYDKKMKLKNTVKVKKGDYSFSLSFGKKRVFVSEDGNYKTGTWYGYKIK